MHRILSWFSRASFILLCLSSQGVFAYQSGSYPSLSVMVYNTQVRNAKVIEHAIEEGNAVNLTYDAEFRSLATILFPSPYFSHYDADKLMAPFFVNTMRSVIAEFACAEYRYRNRLNEATGGCSGFVRQPEQKERMPFVSGPYMSNDIVAFSDNEKVGYSITLSLPAAEKVPLKHLFGAVKQMGTFFGRNFNNKDLILTIRMQAYRLDGNGRRAAKPINSAALIYMVVIPSSSTIADQSSQRAAAQFAIKHARMLVTPQGV